MHQDNFIFLISMNFENIFYAYRCHFSHFWALVLSLGHRCVISRVSSSLQPSTIQFVRFTRCCLLCVLFIVFPFQSFWSIQIHFIWAPSCLIPSFFVSLFSSCHQFICQLPPLVAFVTVSSCLSCLACPCPYPMHVLHSSLLLFSSSTPLLLLQLILFHCLSCSVPSPFSTSYFAAQLLLYFLTSLPFFLPVLSSTSFHLCFILFSNP